MNLIERIQNAVICDDADPAKESECIIATYEEGDIEVKRALDDVFISLTGWSLATMIKELKNG